MIALPMPTWLTRFGLRMTAVNSSANSSRIGTSR
jgi:hypothetical protein